MTTVALATVVRSWLGFLSFRKFHTQQIWLKFLPGSRRVFSSPGRPNPWLRRFCNGEGAHYNVQASQVRVRTGAYRGWIYNETISGDVEDSQRAGRKAKYFREAGCTRKIVAYGNMWK